MNSIDDIHAELVRFAQGNLNIPLDILNSDPDFESLNLDSLSVLELLLHGDDSFGSHVLDYLEDGLIKGKTPTKISELAMLIPLCMKPINELVIERQKMNLNQ